MFGNHPLPNIVPSLLVFSPPPTHIPPPPPPSPLPLANARTGQATARSSLTPTPAHCTASPAPTTIHRHPPAFAPPLVEGCGQTTFHVTAPSSRRVARCQRRPPTATSPLKQPAYATSQPPTTPTRHLTIQKQRVRHVMDDDDWLKRREEQEEVEEEWRGRMEWEGMNEGERGGRGGEGEATATGRCATHTPPPFSFFSPPKSTKTTGRRDIHTPPPFFFFPPSGRQQKQRGRRDIHTPPTFSFFPPPGVDQDNGAV